MINKLENLIKKITLDQQKRLAVNSLDCQCNLDNAIASYKIKKKYTYIDIGNSGRYMVVNDTGEIFGIKGYGVIHRGHSFGTLDTIDDYFWGDYRAIKKDSSCKNSVKLVRKICLEHLGLSEG